MKKTATKIQNPGVRASIIHSTLAAAMRPLLLCSARSSYAAINVTGDVDPGDPASWTSSTDGCIGYTGNGTMDVNDGDSVICFSGCLGYLTARRERLP